MAISANAVVGGASGSKKSSKIYEAPATGTYPAQILNIEDVEEPKWGEPQTLVKKLRLTLAIIDGNPDDVPAYPFDQDPEDPNPYGSYAFKSLTPSINAGGTNASGQTTSESNLHSLLVTVLKGRKDGDGKSLDGKPLTREEIAAFAANPQLLEQVIGKKVSILGEKVDKPTGGSSFRVTAIGTLANPKRYPDYRKPTYRLTAQQKADVDPELVYEDTGEQVYGFHVRDKDGAWKYITANEAATSCVNRHGRLISPAAQAEANRAKTAAPAAAPAKAEQAPF